jgi:hypothetical protein
MTWLTVMEYLCHKWTRIWSTCRKHFPHYWLITGFVTRLTGRVPLVEQELVPVFHEFHIILVIRICKTKNRQQNGQQKKDKQRSTKHTHKTKDRVARTSLKTVVNRAGLKPIGPIVPNWTRRWSYLLLVVHTTGITENTIRPRTSLVAIATRKKWKKRGDRKILLIKESLMTTTHNKSCSLNCKLRFK